MAAGHPVVPDVGDPGLSLEWMCDQFGQIDRPAPQIARAKELGLVLCVIRRKVCIRLSNWVAVFDAQENNQTETVLE